MSSSPYAVWHIYKRHPDFLLEFYAGKGMMTWEKKRCQKYATENRARIVMEALNLHLNGFLVGKCDCFRKGE